ncbi:MAG TPA: peptidoglycan DD-metalloendopeptidase family protein [Gaiellaceae bacterium]
MARRLLLGLACVLLLAAPAAAGDIHRKKREIDDRISSLHSKIANARTQEGVLTQQITVVDAKITSLQDDGARAQNRLNALEGQLAASQRRLDRMTAVFAQQTRKLVQLRREYGVALARLERRVIDAYETPSVNVLDVVLAATSMSSMLSDIEYVHQIGKQDRQISDQLHTAKKRMHAARERTRVLKRRVAEETAAIRARTEEQQSVTQQLVSTQQQLATAVDSKRATLSSIKVNERSFVEEANALQAVSATLAAKIQAAARSAPATSSGSGTPSASGFIWPVNGPITSPFGSRCLPNGDCSFHPGIDIAVPSGTAIKAAAGGTVIYAGSLGGYGNLTVIDHGNGLATAYGHQSSIGVAIGASVAQGQVIGYVGCTGYCFGAHLHFEVRANGEPVNPLSYL